MSISHSSNFSQHPLGKLPQEDLELITQLVLRSGSLKELAQAYDVSYPTIRARLDRVIERLREAVESRPADPLRDLLAGLVERGEMSVSAAQAVRTLVKQREGEQGGVQGVHGGP